MVRRRRPARPSPAIRPLPNALADEAASEGDARLADELRAAVAEAESGVRDDERRKSL